SDWHLGNTLKDKDRTDEFESFLTWVLDALKEEQVDALLVSGDIFDVANPSHRIQEIYYRFLSKIALSGCSQVVIIAGNHDSGLLLDAPKNLLSTISIYVVGNVVKGDLSGEMIELKNKDGGVEMIVCAVPYLKEAALRDVCPKEVDRDIAKLVVEGTRAHYHAVFDLALQRKVELGNPEIPIVAMGHLFAANVSGGKDEGIRDVVGNLGLIDVDVFPEGFDYVALGHIHRAQKIGGLNHIRYSGAPLLMGFDEIGQKRIVHIVDFPKGESCVVEKLEVPSFQEFVRISGDLFTIQKELSLLREKKSNAFVEIIYNGEELINNLSYRLKDDLEEVTFTVVRLMNQKEYLSGVLLDEKIEDLSEMREEEVFLKLLEVNHISEEQSQELLAAFREIIALEEDEGIV
ncbi:MAG TPA: exonuclease SbcCD subunit D C-terminal domain-containing protein, partial [Fibrobacteraceae bacterium]|nr:exonuclease SbcCD subunit D C-terminal domain-containing protein [Fibrobacteraceae bacterium]